MRVTFAQSCASMLFLHCALALMRSTSNITHARAVAAASVVLR
jgi:hypothetical protein